MTKPLRIIRQPEVLSRTGLSAMSVWRKQRDKQFPQRLSLGPNSVGWIEAEVEAWIEARARERDQAASSSEAAARETEPVE